MIDQIKTNTVVEYTYNKSGNHYGSLVLDRSGKYFTVKDIYIQSATALNGIVQL